MIMEKLRSGEFVKWVMIIVVLTFVGSILFAWGMDIGDTKFSTKLIVGKIGKKIIQYPQFNEEFSNRMRMERGKEQEISSFKLANMREELFQQLVAQTILEKEITDMDLKGSPEELINYFRQNPPPGLSNNPYFLKADSVTFDTAKYYQFLDSPEAYNIPGMAYLEEYARNFTIPTNQLQILIASGVKVTDLEARERVLASEEKADVEYCFLPSHVMDLEAGAITDNDIAVYYKANPDSFKTEGMAEVEYVSLPKVSSPEDDSRIKAEMESIHGRLVNGEDFRAVAAEVSEDGTAKDSGDLGTFGRGAMVPEFEDVAFSLKAGEISAPFRSSLGYQIVKVFEVFPKDKTIRAGHILIKVTPSPESMDALREQADSMVAAIKAGAPLESVAKAQGLMVRRTGMVEKGMPFPGFEGEARYLPGLRSLAFNDEDKTAEVLENDEAFFAAVVSKRHEAGVLPLELAKEKIKSALLQKKKEAMARERMEAVLKRVNEEKVTLEEMSKQDLRLQYSKQDNASRLAFLPGLGSTSKAIYRAFAMKEGELSPVVESNGGYAIIRLLKKYSLSEEQIQAQISQTRRSLSEQNRYMVYSDWFENKKKGMEIENDLERFYAQ